LLEVERHLVHVPHGTSVITTAVVLGGFERTFADYWRLIRVLSRELQVDPQRITCGRDLLSDRIAVSYTFDRCVREERWQDHKETLTGVKLG